MVRRAKGFQMVRVVLPFFVAKVVMLLDQCSGFQEAGWESVDCYEMFNYKTSMPATECSPSRTH